MSPLHLSALALLASALAAYRRAPTLRPATLAIAAYVALHAAEDALAAWHVRGVADAAWHVRAGCTLAWAGVGAWLVVRVSEQKDEWPGTPLRDPSHSELSQTYGGDLHSRRDMTPGEFRAASLPVYAPFRGGFALPDRPRTTRVGKLRAALARVKPSTLIALASLITAAALASAWRYLYRLEVPLLHASRLLASVALPIAWSGALLDAVSSARVAGPDVPRSDRARAVEAERAEQAPPTRDGRLGKGGGPGPIGVHDLHPTTPYRANAREPHPLPASPLRWLLASASRPIALLFAWGTLLDLTVGVWARSDPAAAWALADVSTWLQWVGVLAVAAWAAWRGERAR